MRNLPHFGYGIKGFALSMIESAIELTNATIKPADIQTLLDMTKNMLSADIRLIDGVPETLATLAASHTLMLLTKGDLYDQETKIERSGLAHHFNHIEIVSHKIPATYQAILSKYAITPARFLMIGNSLRSDILPVLDIGASAVYIPASLTWAHEMTDSPTNHPNFSQIDQFSQIPTLIQELR
jgi:putative hydrolase of the HAD superfamily